MDQSRLDGWKQALGGTGTRRRSLLVGALLSAVALAPAEAKPKQPKSRKKAKAAKTLWAVVDPGGALAFGSGVASAKKLQGDGAYEVVFERDVSPCALIAQIPYLYSPGEAYVAPGTTSVTVFTYDTSQNRVKANKAFHLIAMC